MENKKVKNATPKEYDGIQFKSLLEVMVYKTLISEGFVPRYEQESFVLFEHFKPQNVLFLTQNKFKSKNKNIQAITPSCAIDMRGIKDMTYTPDFIFDYHNVKVIVEVKGRQNDVYPYKLKLFRHLLETKKEKIMLWEIHSKKQLIDCIRYLRTFVGV